MGEVASGAGGRKGVMSRRTPDVRDTVLKALTEVGSYSAAAGLAGVSRSTLSRWRNDDEDFAADCRRAKAAHFQRSYKRIMADPTLRARDRIRLLEVLHPEIMKAPPEQALGSLEHRETWRVVIPGVTDEVKDVRDMSDEELIAAYRALGRS